MFAVGNFSPTARKRLAVGIARSVVAIYLKCYIVRRRGEYAYNEEHPGVSRPRRDRRLIRELKNNFAVEKVWRGHPHHYIRGGVYQRQRELVDVGRVKPQPECGCNGDKVKTTLNLTVAFKSLIPLGGATKLCPRALLKTPSVTR